MKYTIVIPDWHPASLNQLLALHWAERNRLKSIDATMIRAYGLEAGVPEAQGRRRVTLTLMSRRTRRDPDASWKSLLDGLVTAGFLIDDSDPFAELAPIRYATGPRTTIIELEDLEEDRVEGTTKHTKDTKKERSEDRPAPPSS